MSDRSYDAVIVGGGHNGLVAGYYLARAGMKTVVLERRSFVGGACNTEEFAPGFRASTGAYVLSMLRESIWQDMQLERRGIHVDAAGPTLNLYPDGAHYYLGDDMASNIEETKRFSAADARALPVFEDDLSQLVQGVLPAFNWTAPDPRIRSLHDLLELAKWGRIGFTQRKHLTDLAFLFSTSANQLLSERFTDDHVKAAMGWHAINDSVAGPSTPGTAFVLLHDHASEEADGGVRQWGFVRGGMGVLTATMADAAREVGCEIRCDAEVDQILTRGGRAVGVRLVDGEELGTTRVLSNADPKRTFLSLCDRADLPAEFVGRIEAYRCMGTSIKINLAVSELPYVRGLPEGGVQPYHTGIMEMNPFIADMDFQQAQAVQGIPADPAHIEVCFPTVHDPSLAPEGKHIMTIDVNSQPYHLRDERWDDIKEARADRAIAQMTEHFPKLPDLIEHRQVVTPLDMERLMGLTGGHALHGDMSPDQLLFLRPVRGWADYRTPVRGLYLCGAGTHPGGGVTGANGRNAVREVLKDAGKRGRNGAGR
ncbi:MAG TPA: NAD(P)/FAD-dependent oxidoreductase [Actinomycetota bacterium]|nr:NAD(P)/FAD-dependent oxidoreductase [Actinomycetota bacterium]